MAQLRELQYLDVQDFRVQQADLQDAGILLNLRFYNPNSYRLTLKDGKMDAYFNDRFAAAAVLDERTAVPPLDTFLVPVTIHAPLDRIVVSALDLLTNNEIKVKLEGSIKAGRYGVFLKVPLHYEGKQRIGL